MNDSENIIYGEPPPPGYEEELKELESVVSYEKSILKLEDFGKWLFTSSSIIGVLGAGFSVAGFTNMNWLGRIFFFVSLFCITICLATSAFALSPKLVNYRQSSVDSIKGVIEENIIKSKGIKLRVSGILFSLAILFAGLTSLTSQIIITPNTPYVHLAHEYLNDNITFSIAARNIYPHKALTIAAYSYYRGKNDLLYHSSEYPISSGEFDKKILLQKNYKPFSFDSIFVSISWYTGINASKDTVYKILSMK